MAKVIHTDSRGRMYRKLTRDEQYQNDRERVLTARLRAEGNKSELYAYIYGAVNMKSDEGKLLLAGRRAALESTTIKYTTKGDFTHLHSGHNELRG